MVATEGFRIGGGGAAWVVPLWEVCLKALYYSLEEIGQVRSRWQIMWYTNFDVQCWQ